MNRLAQYFDDIPQPIPLFNVGLAFGLGWFVSSIIIELLRYVMLALAGRLGLTL